jgi:hypothetical protein
MVVTELDKKWVKRIRARAIREMPRARCAQCGARAVSLAPIDWSAPERIEWLCVRHKNQLGLSQLQRWLLRQGLMGYYREPLDLALARSDVGCFQIRFAMKSFTQKRFRARRRAAAGLAITRLIRRGLVQRCECAGRWRLTRAGLALAKRLYPEIRRSTKRQLATEIFLVRAMPARRTRPRARPRKSEHRG